MMNFNFQKSIEEAAHVIGKTWPLYSFVTSNPLAGYEKIAFGKAVKQAKNQLNAEVFPQAAVFNQALDQGDIDKNILEKLLVDHDFFDSIEEYKHKMASYQQEDYSCDNQELNSIMSKWLAVFMDEGLAEWEMPCKEEGFYKAWRKLAIYDSDIPKTTLSEIPKTSHEALSFVLQDFDAVHHTSIFISHLAALPGWTGYINYRVASNSDWQLQYPITLIDYMAVRLWIARKIGAHIYPETTFAAKDSSISKLQLVWLKAWEKTWQTKLLTVLEQQMLTLTVKEQQIADAQLVFCIDTRSESIRRHVESKGNYETFGYAGFFGIAMDYENLKDGFTRKSCPPIVSSAYHVCEVAQSQQSEKLNAFNQRKEVLKFKDYFLKRMKNMLPSAFGFVEGSGLLYGLSLTARTLLPGSIYRLNQKYSANYESLCQPEIKSYDQSEMIASSIPLDQKVAIVKSAFDLMGWKQFAPLVLFVGHGSHSANNAFGSSLDCGACAASPGRHNARMLAALANETDVKQILREEHGIEIPNSTIFIGCEHNTTTDEIVLFDSGIPQQYHLQVQNLKLDLTRAQQSATQERLGTGNKSVALAQKKANDWSETRPEWGLAKNAAFIIGSRQLTKETNLEGRCFLHSYDWEMDTTGKALEGIMQGPMVVTQWINNHYYFSTVDNSVFGGGSKITHNVTGKFGVVEGNGGDLKMGLPLQSLMQSDIEMYHQPLRLSVVIHAPVSRVSEILLRNEHLQDLLNNEWIYLMVIDPLEGNEVYQYSEKGNWIKTKKLSISSSTVAEVVL
ncbi:DUF2309 domain-containing protein [Flavobacterium sp. F-380]|uniref:Probable inorganic carbon transporter subunit DabA n=1 Tax=Flavobacterium kayseriense TaxID=2764714 RepID=A0ABR7J5Z4_9FLAO|nr:DUF2309 domain-containing protein [Flavobacterium kayseriense]MBC5840833.1 DUF2309 domain-containing protein [Flavobacterium kayseriense]MBC5846497.1 DUF2309 domain-containing protein [Flavobacterium kayseriense]